MLSKIWVRDVNCMWYGSFTPCEICTRKILKLVSKIEVQLKNGSSKSKAFYTGNYSRHSYYALHYCISLSQKLICAAIKPCSTISLIMQFSLQLKVTLTNRDSAEYSQALLHTIQISTSYGQFCRNKNRRIITCIVFKHEKQDFLLLPGKLTQIQIPYSYMTELSCLSDETKSEPFLCQ